MSSMVLKGLPGDSEQQQDPLSSLYHPASRCFVALRPAQWRAAAAGGSCGGTAHGQCAQPGTPTAPPRGRSCGSGPAPRVGHMQQVRRRAGRSGRWCSRRRARRAAVRWRCRPPGRGGPRRRSAGGRGARGRPPPPRSPVWRGWGRRGWPLAGLTKTAANPARPAAASVEWGGRGRAAASPMAGHHLLVAQDASPHHRGSPEKLVLGGEDDQTARGRRTTRVAVSAPPTTRPMAV